MLHLLAYQNTSVVECLGQSRELCPDLLPGTGPGHVSQTCGKLSRQIVQGGDTWGLISGPSPSLVGFVVSEPVMQ